MHVLTQLVNGAGGLGKTHTVIECLHRSRDMFELLSSLLENPFREIEVRNPTALLAFPALCTMGNSTAKATHAKIHGRPWQRDATTTECNRCDTTFTFFLRKHHCRSCGKIVCYKCSRFEKLPGDPIAKRVCEDWWRCHLEADAGGEGGGVDGGGKVSGGGGSKSQHRGSSLQASSSKLGNALGKVKWAAGQTLDPHFLKGIEHTVTSDAYGVEHGSSTATMHHTASPLVELVLHHLKLSDATREAVEGVAEGVGGVLSIAVPAIAIIKNIYARVQAAKNISDELWWPRART